MVFMDLGKKKKVNLTAENFIFYVLEKSPVLSCMDGSIKNVCKFFDKLSSIGNITVPDSLYLEMMIDISDGTPFYFNNKSFMFC